jgi:hypothetical protein
MLRPTESTFAIRTVELAGDAFPFPPSLTLAPLLFISGVLSRQMPMFYPRNPEDFVSQLCRYTYIKGVLTGPGIEILGDGSRCATPFTNQNFLIQDIYFLPPPLFSFN